MDLIIGGGTYGKLAFDKIKDEGDCIVVIDEDPGCVVQKDYGLPEFSDGECLSEGAVFLKGGIGAAATIIAGSLGRSGLQEGMEGRVFPTAPVHILAGIISEICGFVPDPKEAEHVAGLIPEDLIIGRKDADIYCSLNRDNPCLPRCPSPKVCPVTGERRETPLWETLRNSFSGNCEGRLPFSVVIESRQLSAGLGYIECSDLTEAIGCACKEDAILAGTACMCHGVVTALIKN